MRICEEYTQSKKDYANSQTYSLKSYVFISVIIYMGIHKEPQIRMYWNSDFNKGALHSITNHISLRRFEQIKRYCHISCPESDQRKGYHLPSNEIW